MAIFSQNRQDFYRIVIPKLPEGAVRNEIMSAARPVPLPDVDHASIQWDGLETLLLRDVFKKPAFGQTAAKCVISLRSLVETAQMIEEAGVLLFQGLGRSDRDVRQPWIAASEAHQASLMALIRIEDALRYHRIRLIQQQDKGNPA
ncbi:hypothetical protein HZB60_06870 [candidate division KSB1 bacterium]|nr:hypothetical protein [candidate division KSB1 bacterium]